MPQFLEAVQTTEQQARQERRIRTALRLSRLPVGRTLANDDFGFQRGIDWARSTSRLQPIYSSLRAQLAPFVAPNLIRGPFRPKAGRNPTKDQRPPQSGSIDVIPIPEPGSCRQNLHVAAMTRRA
ncbi:MAG: hypothetical protein D6761_01720 [Candidatus Dadabacteria bacterium]|nr:MAG: hypothetical protein D6761_01720 [Candidatus Dadabacteria bacterium]